MRGNAISKDEHLIRTQIDNWLITLLNGKKRDEPIIELANSVLREYKEQIGSLNPPINLNDLGKFMHIKRISLSNKLSVDALLIPVKNGFKIKLKKSKVPSTRRRYSCAHEMAHTFFYNVHNNSIPTRTILSGSYYEEELCDKAAAEFLMPFKIFKKKRNLFTRRYGYSCKTVIKLADTFETSLQSVTRRLIEGLDNNTWDNYLVTNWHPIYEKNNVISRFRLKWQVPIKNMTVQREIYEDHILFDILFSEIKKIYPRFNNEHIENQYNIEGVNIKVSPLYFLKEGFLILMSIKEYLKALDDSYKNHSPSDDIIIDFNFERKRDIDKKTKLRRKKKLELSDFL